MITLHLDAETYSAVPISKGLARYFADPTYELLMLAWAIGSDPVNLWVPVEGEPMPQLLRQALLDPDVQIHAFNAAFEFEVVQRLGMEIPVSRFYCVMVQAWQRSFSGSLEDIQAQLHMPVDTLKLREGRKFINRFCKPAPASHKEHRYTRHTHPEEWGRFKNYCKQDVIAERELELVLGKYPASPPVEREYWILDQNINQRGMRLDLPLVDAALRVDRQIKKRLRHHLVEATGLENPGSRDQFLQWLQDQGIQVEDVRKETMEALLPQDISTDLTRAIELRLQYKKTSNAKWKAMKEAVSADGRLRGAYQFAAAQRTNRWGGRIVQPHNLPGSLFDDQEEYDAAVDSILCEDAQLLDAIWGNSQALLSQSIRGAIVSSPGYRLIVADYNAIESRVVGWLANCERINRIFRDGLDTYKDFATELFKVPYDEVTSAMRKFSKPPVLGAAYMLGHRGLIAYADGWDISMDEPQAKHAINTFRSMYSEIPVMWSNLMEAIERAIRTPGQWFSTNRVAIGVHLDMLLIRLPSGRYLHYHLPLWQKQETPWGEMRPGFSYMGMDQKTHKWVRIKAHAGLITENITQAVARDLLAYALLKAEKARLFPVGHVHDEIVGEIPIEETEEKLKTLIHIMSRTPSWAEGLLLSTTGWSGRRFRKD